MKVKKRKHKNRTVALSGSNLIGHESRAYHEEMVITFREEFPSLTRNVVISMDLYDLTDLAKRIHQHVAAQKAKLNDLSKALRGEP